MVQGLSANGNSSYWFDSSSCLSHHEWALLCGEVNICLFAVISWDRLEPRRTWEGLGHSLALEANGRGIVFQTSKIQHFEESHQMSSESQLGFIESCDRCHAGTDELLPVQRSHFFFHPGKAFTLSTRWKVSLRLDAVSWKTKRNKSLNARILLSELRCLGWKGVPKLRLWKEEHVDVSVCCEVYSLRMVL